MAMPESSRRRQDGTALVEELEKVKSKLTKIEFDKLQGQLLNGVNAEHQRVQRYVQLAGEAAPPFLVPYIKMFSPVLSILGTILSYVMWVYLLIWDVLSKFKYLCPPALFTATCGLCMCFFGGKFPTIIAAFEAWNMSVSQTSKNSLNYIFAEITKIRKLNDQDDKKDDDRDGTADVLQMSGRELMQRKMSMVLTQVDPTKLNDAISGIYTGWMGVVAALKLQFARVIALGAIGEALRKPVGLLVVPCMTHLIPEKHRKWIPVVIDYTIKMIAVSLAWIVESYISMVHSGIRGGLMCARGIVDFLYKQGKIDFNNDGYIDEVVGFTLAVCGIWFQMTGGLPWVFSVWLWPIQWAEEYVRFTIGGAL